MPRTLKNAEQMTRDMDVNFSGTMTCSPVQIPGKTIVKKLTRRENKSGRDANFVALCWAPIGFIRLRFVEHLKCEE